MILDIMRRLLIVASIALVIGVLFVGATMTLAEGKMDVELQHSLLWPTEGEITDTFGTRGGKHFGIDIAAPQGQMVISVEDGKVTRSYYSDSYGHAIFIEHDNGLETIYAHLHERYVQEGEKIHAGQSIGTVGNTGHSTGNHLHFEVHDGNWNIKKSNSIDPLLVLSEQPRFFVLDEKEAIETINEVQEKEEEEESVQTVTIKRGDTLSHLARNYGVTVSQLKEWNGLTSDLIYVNDSLKIGPGEKEIHIVQKGETLSKVSRLYELSLEELMRKNNLNNDQIFPGDVLSIK